MSISKFSGAYSMGSSHRELFDPRNNFVPGPGNYDPTFIAKQKAPNIIFNKHKKDELFTKSIDSPAPGFHQSDKLCQSGIKYSMRKKTEIPYYKNKNFGYHVKEVKKKVPSYTISHNNKNYIKDLNDSYDIGPGDYLKDQLDYSFEKEQNSIDFSIILNQKKKQQKKNNSYDYKSYLDQDLLEQEKYKKILDFQSNGILSSSILKGNKKTDFGTQKRFQNPMKGIPGPTDYEQLQSSLIQKTNTSYTIKKQNEIHNSLHDNPGPAQYYTNFDSKQKIEISISKAKRKELFEIDEGLPSPDKYQPKIINRTIPIKFQTSKRQEFANELIKKETPSPDKYYPIKPICNLQFSLGNEIKFKQHNKSVPGVGDYELQGSIILNKKHNMPLREYKQIVFRTPIPGPADYEKQKEKVKHGTISRSQRFQINLKEQELTPGPGHYNNQQIHKVLKLPNIAKSFKQTEDYKNPNIGPGTYQINTDFNKIPSYLKNNQLRIPHSEKKHHLYQ